MAERESEWGNRVTDRPTDRPSQMGTLRAQRSHALLAHSLPQIMHPILSDRLVRHTLTLWRSFRICSRRRALTSISARLHSASGYARTLHVICREQSMTRIEKCHDVEIRVRRLVNQP